MDNVLSNFANRTSQFQSTLKNPAFKITGPEFVSARCKGYTATTCVRKGCQWSEEPAGNDSHLTGKKLWRCVDPTQWQCSVQKKVMDCQSYRAMSFVNVFAGVDQLCGKFYLGQKKENRTICSGGPRVSESCDPSLKGKDCPVLDKIYGQKDLVGDMTKGKVSVNSNEDEDHKVSSGQCETHARRLGCVAGGMRDCDGMNYDKIGVMML